MEDSFGNLINNGISNLTIDNGNILKLTIGNISSTSDIEKIRIVDDEINVTTIPQSGGSMSFKIECNCFTDPGVIPVYNLPPFDICFYRHPNASISNLSFISNPAPQQGTESHENITISFTTLNENLMKDDLLILTFTTSYSTFFSTSNSFTTNTSSTTSGIWLEDSNGNLISNGISNLTIDNGNVLKLTIGNISSTSDIEKIRIVDNETNITTIPQSGGSMSFKIECNCFTDPGVISVYNLPPFDVCFYRDSNASITETEFYAENFNVPPADTTPGALDYIKLVKITFKAESEPLKGQDIIIIKFITSYRDSANVNSGFFQENMGTSQFTINSSSGGILCCWITDDSNNIQSNMISSISMTNSTSGNNPVEYIQNMSITLSGTQNYGSANDKFIINIQGSGSGSLDMTQLPNLDSYIDYQLDINCFTGSGKQDGIDWDYEPCANRSGSLIADSVSRYATNPYGGQPHDYEIITITPDGDDIVGGDIILVKFRTTYESYFNNAMTNSDWYKNYVFNNNTSSLERPQVYIYTSFPSTANLISSITTTDSEYENSSSKWVHTVSITLSGDSSTTVCSDGTSLNIYFAADSGNNAHFSVPPITGGTVEHNVDINCFTETGYDSNLTYNILPPIINLSLLPQNFGGYNALSNPIGNNSSYKYPIQPLSFSHSSYQVTTSDSDFVVVLKFTLLVDITTNDTIKLTMFRQNDTSINSYNFQILNGDPWPISGGVANNGWNYIQLKSGNNIKSISSLSLGTYNETLGSQDITLTVGENISASDITINFYDNGYNNWNENTRDGEPLTFNLEVSNHYTSSGNMGWYVQDITHIDNQVNTLDTKTLFTSVAGTSSKFIFRHYTPIPENSKIRLIFRTEHVKNSTTNYTIFNTPFSTTEDYIENTNNPTSSQCGIWINSKDLTNNTVSNSIEISSFKLGGIKASNYVALDSNGNYPNTNYGSIEYLEFTVTESGGIPGDLTGTSYSKNYIEININQQQLITVNKLGDNAFGELHYSIEVRDSNDVLIGGVYQINDWNTGAFTIYQDPLPSNMAMIPIRFNAIPDSELGTADALPGYTNEYNGTSRSKYSPTINILSSDKILHYEIGWDLLLIILLMIMVLQNI